MNKTKSVVAKSCSSSLIFLYKNCFQDDFIDFWHKKLTLKAENAQFLTELNQVVSQDLKKPFEEAHLDVK